MTVYYSPFTTLNIFIKPIEFFSIQLLNKKLTHYNRSQQYIKQQAHILYTIQHKEFNVETQEKKKHKSAH